MKRECLFIRPVGMAMILSLWVLPAMADVLRVGGTGGATPMLEHVAKPFTQQTGITVEVIPSLGSAGGISAAADGVLDVAITGRPLSAIEQDRGMVQAVAMRTPYVFATSLGPPSSMTVRQIVDVYAVEKAAWPDGTTIKLILRPRAEADNLVLTSTFPGMAAALEEARKRSGIPIAATDQDNADLAERVPGSITGTTYSQIIMEKRNLRLVAIDGVAPTIEAFESGAYRYTKVFHVVHRQQPSPAVKSFVQFLRSPDGVRALREAGCLPNAE